jgi:uncharacterized protein (DUF1330 family)
MYSGRRRGSLNITRRPRLTGTSTTARSPSPRHGKLTLGWLFLRSSRGGRFPARGNPAKTYEGGIDLRTVLIEFDSLPQRSLVHDSPGYQAALAALGNSAERDVRILEGVDG